jgi:hypothetical protein
MPFLRPGAKKTILFPHPKGREWVLHFDILKKVGLKPFLSVLFNSPAKAGGNSCFTWKRFISGIMLSLEFMLCR